MMEEDAYDMAVAYADVNEEKLIAMKKYCGKDGKINMCKGLEELLEGKHQEGINLGIEQGIRALIESYREIGVDKEATLAKVLQKFEITEEKACEYIEKYWK